MTPMLGYGAAMLAGAVLLAALGGNAAELPLQGGAAVAALALGLLLARVARPRPGATRPRVARSGATVLVAVGVALMAFGAEAGQWLILIGAGTAVVGIGGLIAERRRT